MNVCIYIWMYMVYVKHLLFSFSQAASGIFAYICIKCVVCSASFIYNIVILTYMQPFSGHLPDSGGWSVCCQQCTSAAKCPAPNAGARLNGDMQSHSDVTVTLKSLLLEC